MYYNRYKNENMSTFPKATLLVSDVQFIRTWRFNIFWMTHLHFEGPVVPEEQNIPPIWFSLSIWTGLRTDQIFHLLLFTSTLSDNHFLRNQHMLTIKNSILQILTRNHLHCQFRLANFQLVRCHQCDRQRWIPLCSTSIPSALRTFDCTHLHHRTWWLVSFS